LSSLLISTKQNLTAFFNAGIDFLGYIPAVMDKFKNTKGNVTDRENSKKKFEKEPS
jgi:hypothetical protein